MKLTLHESPYLEVDWAQRTFSLRSNLPGYLGRFTNDMHEADPDSVGKIWEGEAIESHEAPPDHVLVVRSAVWNPEEWKMVFIGDIEGPQ